MRRATALEIAIACRRVGMGEPDGAEWCRAVAQAERDQGNHHLAGDYAAAAKILQGKIISWRDSPPPPD